MNRKPRMDVVAAIDATLDQLSFATRSVTFETVHSTIQGCDEAARLIAISVFGDNYSLTHLSPDADTTTMTNEVLAWRARYTAHRKLG